MQQLSVLFFVAFICSSCNALLPMRLTAVKSRSIRVALKMDSSDSSKSPSAGFLGGIGVAANLLCDYSLFALKTTGCNVVPRPDGTATLLAEQSLGTAAVFGIFAWSLYTKVKTGSGLPAGKG